MYDVSGCALMGCGDSVLATIQILVLMSIVEVRLDMGKVEQC